MTKADFVDKLAYSGTRLRANARKALERIFVDGVSQADVAREMNLSTVTISNYVKAFRKL